MIASFRPYPLTKESRVTSRPRDSSPTPHAVRRTDTLQSRLHPKARERLREVRAVLVLEARSTVDSRRLLQRLAAGLSEARLTQDAKAALERLPG